MGRPLFEIAATSEFWSAALAQHHMLPLELFAGEVYQTPETFGSGGAIYLLLSISGELPNFLSSMGKEKY